VPVQTKNPIEKVKNKWAVGVKTNDHNLLRLTIHKIKNNIKNIVQTPLVKKSNFGKRLKTILLNFLKTALKIFHNK
jgi:phage baseplate assembly protein W